MIPQTFEQWKHCIVDECQIRLTKEFANQRLEVYKNKQHPETSRFIQLYGEQHLNNIITWFQLI